MRPIVLMSLVMDSFKRLLSAHLKDITDSLLSPLHINYQVSGWRMGLDKNLIHLSSP